MSVDLPPNPYSRDSMHANAYDRCIMLETHTPNLNSKPPTLVCARLLGYLLIHALVDKGRDSVADDILNCRCNEDLIELADFFITHLFRCFKAAKDRTPTPSNHPSNPEFENTQEMLGYLLAESPKDHSTAKRMALARDGYRCMITGLYDTHSYDKFPEIKQEAMSYGRRIVVTNASYILPASTNQGTSGSQECGWKYKYASGVWAVMECFGDISIADELNGAGIHRLQNILTLCVDLHAKFDSLSIWLEEDPDTANKYHVCSRDPIHMMEIPVTVVFTSRDKKLPLPDPRYLRIHAACAKVAHLSGAAEYIDGIFRDMDDTRVLATNGSSAELLSYALRGDVGLTY